MMEKFIRDGVGNRMQTVTPVGLFGVEVRLNESDVYWCKPVAESQATYVDGKMRPWQERGGIGRYPARADVLRIVIKGGR